MIPPRDDGGCAGYHPGRPGDGVLVMALRGWRAPQNYRLDEHGRPARTDRRGNGRHRLTARADVLLLRAMDATATCDGDGHYQCRGCIYWRAKETQ